VNSRAKRAKKIFVPPIRTSWGLHDAYIIMHNYAVNRKFKCLQYQSDATRHLQEVFAMSDDQLFSKINSNSLHILQQFMPDRPSLNYSLRARPH